MAAFVASARSLDRGVGAVLDALDSHGHRANTLVICTTDHGIAFPGAKATMTDRGIGVMLIMRGPGGFLGGKASDALVSHIDIFPTICDVLGVRHPEWLQGRSFLPVIRGETAEIRDAVFAEGTYHAAYEPQRCIRTPRWKYVRRFEPRNRPVLPNTDDSPSKDVWLRWGWPKNLIEPEQLYDLQLDPNEAENRGADPDLEPVAGELRVRLERWMRGTSDPLLDGPVPPPAGAEFNDPDGRSAAETPLRAR
jgi:arylsulfatase A-like enzyme